MPAVPTAPIVFFDGVCGLCNGFVDRLMRWDRKRVLRYATLQGTTAAELLPGAHTQALSTIVYVDERGSHTRSDAVLLILRRLGGGWTLTAVLRIIPRFVRDAVYNWVARNRYGWFGRHDSCRLPTAEERAYFLP